MGLTQFNFIEIFSYNNISTSYLGKETAWRRKRQKPTQHCIFPSLEIKRWTPAYLSETWKKLRTWGCTGGLCMSPSARQLLHPRTWLSDHLLLWPSKNNTGHFNKETFISTYSDLIKWKSLTSLNSPGTQARSKTAFQWAIHSKQRKVNVTSVQV